MRIKGDMDAEEFTKMKNKQKNTTLRESVIVVNSEGVRENGGYSRDLGFCQDCPLLASPEITPPRLSFTA